MESNVLLSTKQRYLPSGVLFGPKLFLFVRLNCSDKKVHLQTEKGVFL